MRTTHGAAWLVLSRPLHKHGSFLLLAEERLTLASRIAENRTLPRSESATSSSSLQLFCWTRSPTLPEPKLEKAKSDGRMLFLSWPTVLIGVNGGQRRNRWGSNIFFN